MSVPRDELNKPATSLYVHNLTCTLEAAVRATNAQFEPQHVLARLHVNLYPNCKHVSYIQLLDCRYKT